ncbi:MAG: hypothetical protein O7E52_20950 [Candidatus Poribacteria bacterium]|nr:hypothetical protein [Candidatus Poribacteria bacterium]
MIKSLQQSVQSVIDEGRIGSPVFLRCMVQAPIEAGNAVNGIAALTALANTWMPSALEQVYALDSADETQVTAMVQYAGGQTAILSLNRIASTQEPSVDLVLVGNKGVIYHETPAGQHRLMRAPIVLSGGESLVNLIHQAIKTKQPVKMMED